MLSEISKSRNDKYRKIPLHEASEVVTPTEVEKRMAVPRGWRWGDGESSVGKVSVVQNEKVLEISCTTMCMYLTILYCILTNLL